MIEPFSMTEAMNHVESRHAVMVHMPIALASLGVPFALAVAIRPCNKMLRIITIALFVALFISACLAVNSGEAAYEKLRGLPEHVDLLVDQHKVLANRTYILAAGVVILLGLGALKKKPLRLGATWLAVVVALLSAGLMAQAAHKGGTAVYQFGVGTPDVVSILDTPAPEDGDPNADAPITTNDARAAFFVNNVFPILDQNCLRCHNPTRANRSGGLDQTSMTAMLAGGGEGPAIVIGNPDASPLWQRMVTDDFDKLMPPDGDAVTAEEAEIIAQWIRDGAVWANPSR
ncbi:MAG: c-type cytochrome domain-containing protein [Planctomycetota bacterium]